MKKNDSKKAKFFCESCGSEVPSKSKFCPTCGKFFASVRCPKCGKTGFNEEFKNGCPNCGYAVNTSGNYSDKNTSIFNKIFRGRSYKNDSDSSNQNYSNKNEVYGLPAWIYITTFIVLIILVICLYSCLYS